jgi:hypothetical protein
MPVELETSPIIIYGAPRSGTTYLREILNQHPEVFISHETRVFSWLHQSLKVLTQNDEFLVSYRERFVDHLRVEYPQLIRNFYRKLEPQARYWGDKNPHYADKNQGNLLDTVVDLFPGTRFIHIIRDGRDVATSLIQQRHPNGKPWVDFDSAHWTWTSHVDHGCSFGRSLPTSLYFEVRYESLVANDTNVARKLFAFLGIELHPNVVSFCDAQQERRVASSLTAATRDLSGDPSASNWNKVLNKGQQLRSLELLGAHLIRYGYETEASLHAAQRWLLELQPSVEESTQRERS